MVKEALVVDNDFFFVEFLSDLLEKRGYSVQRAYDGKEALDHLKNHSVDLLFVDNVMPKIDGPQLIEFIGTRLPERHFPIVLVSSTVIEQLDTLKRFGADFYVAKGPMDKMERHVNELLDLFEQNKLPPADIQERILEPSDLFPRQTTSEFIESLAFERGLTESIGLGILVVDRDARILRANKMALEILGDSLANTLGTHVGVLFRGAAGRKVIEALKGTVMNQQKRCIRFQIGPNERRIRIHASLFRVEGAISGWILAMEDTVA